MHAIIQEIRKERAVEDFVPIILRTDRGHVNCRYYPVNGTRRGAIWVGGIGGDFDTPGRDSYPSLCKKLQEQEVASLRVQFRHPTDLEESVHDVLAGIAFLESEGITRIALTGHSFGGAVAIQSAALSPSVQTVVTLATQSYGADAVRDFHSGCSILLIHGSEDRTLPVYCSEYAFHRAHETKKLIILEGNGHGLDRSADEMEQLVQDWILVELG